MTGPELEHALRAYFKEHFPHGHVVVISLFPIGGTIHIEQREARGAEGYRFQQASWRLDRGETMTDTVQRIRGKL